MRLFHRPASRIRSLTAALVTLAFLSAPPAGADERRMEEIAMGWIEAHNSGQVERMAAFRATHRKSAKSGWEEQFESLGKRMGRLEVTDVMIEGPGRLVLGIESAGAGRLSATFLFDDGDPEQIASIRISSDDSGPNPLPPLKIAGDDWKSRKKAIDAYLDDLTSQGIFSGVVLIADGETLRFAEAYGLASREFGVANTLDTRFDIGSITKDFTRVAVAQLVADGKLGVDDPVGKHLPNYPNPEVREKVTVGHLFSHSSGIPDYFTQEWGETPMGALRDHDDYIAIWGPKALAFEPGSRQEYSNFGFTVLGAIVEAVAGKPYFDYVLEKVLAPAGATGCGFFATDEIVPDVAVGYTFMRGGGERGPTPRKNIYLEPVVGGPWGKTYCTAEDLWRFWLALSRHRLTPAVYTPWVLLTRSAPEPGETAESTEPVRNVGLGGGGPGLAAELEVVEDRVFVVLANLDPPITAHLARRLDEALGRSRP